MRTPSNHCNLRGLRLGQILRQPEVMVAIAIWLMVGLVFLVSADFPGIGGGIAVDPSFFPRLLAIAWAILGLFLASSLIWGRQKSSLIFPERKRLITLGYSLLFLFASPFLFNLLGFPLASFLYIFLLICLLKPREGAFTRRTIIRWFTPPLLVAAVATFVLYAMFAWGAMVPLPRGLLFY